MSEDGKRERGLWWMSIYIVVCPALDDGFGEIEFIVDIHKTFVFDSI